MQNDAESIRPLEGVRVLIVEDNAPIREAIRRFLTDAGCEVIEAGAPGEAIRMARADSSQIDVALIDLILPEMTGPECVDILKENRPGLAIAYMSGYAEAVSSGYPEDDTPALLAKPFAHEELVRTIRHLVDSGLPPTG